MKHIVTTLGLLALSGSAYADDASDIQMRAAAQARADRSELAANCEAIVGDNEANIKDCIDREMKRETAIIDARSKAQNCEVAILLNLSNKVELCR
jgi:hypothetical protein